jgi:hypothetical protein
VRAITNYKEYYDKTDWDARHIKAKYILKQFETTGIRDDAGKTGDVLYEEVKNTASEMPHSYLIFIKDSRRISVLHRAMHFTAPMGGSQEPWMNKVLMFTRDVIENQLPKAAILPPRILGNLGVSIRCHTLERMMLAFVKNDDLQIFEHITLDAAENTYEEVWTRSAVYLPVELASAFLAERLTPRRALMKVNSFCNFTESPEDYNILLDWLRIACMEDGKVAIQRGQNPTVPIMDDELVTRLLRTATTDLPDWNLAEAPAPVTPTNVVPPLDAWERMFERVLENRVPQAAAADTEKINKPSQAWKGTMDILLRLCQVSSEEDLSQLWHDWANCKKELRCTVLQEHLRRMARALKLPVPIATTTDLANALYSLAFTGSYKGNLEQGLQPFITTTYLGEQSLAEQHALNEMSDLLREGMPRLDDILDLKAAGKLLFP